MVMVMMLMVLGRSDEVSAREGVVVVLMVAMVTHKNTHAGLRQMTVCPLHMEYLLSYMHLP